MHPYVAFQHLDISSSFWKPKSGSFAGTLVALSFFLLFLAFKTFSQLFQEIATNSFPK